MKRLSDSELERAKRNLREAKVSLACEGLNLSEEQEALFRSFEDARLPHAERRQRIIARYSGKGGKVEAAE